MTGLVVDKKPTVWKLGLHDPPADQWCNRVCSIADEENWMAGVATVRPVELVGGANLPGCALDRQERPNIASCRRDVLQKVPVLGKLVDSVIGQVDTIGAKDRESRNITGKGDARADGTIKTTRELVSQS